MFGSFASQMKKMIIDYVCEVNMELGKQIKKYRIENELSQEELIKLFQEYGYDYNKIPNEIKEKDKKQNGREESVGC